MKDALIFSFFQVILLKSKIESLGIYHNMYSIMRHVSYQQALPKTHPYKKHDFYKVPSGLVYIFTVKLRENTGIDLFFYKNNYSTTFWTNRVHIRHLPFKVSESINYSACKNISK